MHHRILLVAVISLLLPQLASAQPSPGADDVALLTDHRVTVAEATNYVSRELLAIPGRTQTPHLVGDPALILTWNATESPPRKARNTAPREERDGVPRKFETPRRDQDWSTSKAIDDVMKGLLE